MPDAAARRMLISLIALLPAAPAAGAGPHTVTVRIADGQSAYTQKVRIKEGSQGNFMGPVKAAGAGEAMMIFNGLLSPGGAPGALTLQYQAELTLSRGARKRTVQGQSELAMRPGDETAVIKCGPWTVTLGLDAGPAGKKPAGGAWNPGGLPNFRLQTDMRAGGSRQQCLYIAKAGARSSVTDSTEQNGRKYGFILNGLFAGDAGGNNFSLQYQLELGTNPLAKPVQTQNETDLVLNRKKTLSGQNYRIDFLLEGDARPKQQGDGGGKKAEPKSEYGTVQPL